MAQRETSRAFNARVEREYTERKERYEALQKIPDDQLDYNAYRAASNAFHATAEEMKNPPYLALFGADLAETKRLIEVEGFEADTVGLNGNTPVAQAAYSGDVAVVDYYISKKVNIDVPGLGGITPLALAAMNDKAEVFEKLLAAGAKLTPHVRQLAELNDSDDVLDIIDRIDSQKTQKPKAKPLAL